MTKCRGSERLLRPFRDQIAVASLVNSMGEPEPPQRVQKCGRTMAKGVEKADRGGL